MSIMDAIKQIRGDIDKNRYNRTQNGKCTGCGSCCSNLLPLTQNEIESIHKYIRQHNIKERRQISPAAASVMNLNCPFLDISRRDKKCTIYPVRPGICREFICDSTIRRTPSASLVAEPHRIVIMRKEFFG